MLSSKQIVFSLQQSIVCRLPKEHPLAKQKQLRLYECLEHKIAAPNRESGIREQIDKSAIRLGLKANHFIQSDNELTRARLARQGRHLLFDIPVNNYMHPVDDDVWKTVPLDERDVSAGFVFVGHLRGRALPVAAARFMENVVEAFAATDQ